MPTLSSVPVIAKDMGIRFALLRDGEAYEFLRDAVSIVVRDLSIIKEKYPDMFSTEMSFVLTRLGPALEQSDIIRQDEPDPDEWREYLLYREKAIQRNEIPREFELWKTRNQPIPEKPSEEQ